MDGIGAVAHGRHALGSRIPLMSRAPAAYISDTNTPMSTRVLSARSECKSEDASQCELPSAGINLTVPITVSVVGIVVILVGVLLWLHRRNVKKQRLEDMNDPHKSLDFGLTLDLAGKSGKSTRKSGMFGSSLEKPGNHSKGLSMDMNLSSPYLLPPGLQSSRESLHSLARTLHNNEDPYRPVASYAGSDVTSLRSFKRNPREDMSIHTGSSGGGKEAGGYLSSRLPPTPTTPAPLLRKTSLPMSPASPSMEIPLPRYEPSQGDMITPPSPAPVKDSFASQAVPDNDRAPYPDDKPGVPSIMMPSVPEIQEPPLSADGHRSNAYDSRPLDAPTPHHVDLNFDFGELHNASAAVEPLSPRPKIASVEPILEKESSLAQPFHHPRASSPTFDNHHFHAMTPAVQVEYEDEQRGRSQHRRQSSEYPQDAPASNPNRLTVVGQQDQKRLSVAPQHGNKRLSVGFRPLPPDELIDSEDPETRANRIRSFYKEYFDESKPQDANHQPTQFSGNGSHQGYQQQQGGYHGGHDQTGYGQGGFQNAGGAHYYEDYDQNYLGDATYFDPDSNAFVMPYAQPVARRAMTPPPSGSRFPGPRRDPRAFHGSMSGMSNPGSRGPPRPGSSASNGGRWGPGPRPGSSASQWGRPRAGSAFSGRSGPRKPMPPPQALTTLPNPSKLRDDSFALFNASDFAPPSTFKDQAAGRSQSPSGLERKEYVTPLAGHSPLISAFEEMPALPSPHLLRKSGTFTGLDFAPPRKFKDADTMSDAGSIRSNRSGLSAVQLGAIRGGAGRVSRLPGDTVFTQAALAEQLKPSWTPHS